MEWPSIPLDVWENSKITLHLYLQIIGKIKLALAPRKNHWWHITLLPHIHGLTTGWVPCRDGTFQITLDMVHHRLVTGFSDGSTEEFPLQDGLTVARFYESLMAMLADHGIRPEIKAIPYDHPCKEPFATCRTYHHYDAGRIRKFHDALTAVSVVFEKFRTRFLGKVSPVQLYWHHMDLAVTRFNGKRGPEPSPGASQADRDAYSHEVISAGFWAGDEQVRGAAFYSYTFPSPEGLEKSRIVPDKARWDLSSGSPMAMLMYEDLLAEDNPESALLEFLESTYQAGATLGKWPVNELMYRTP